MAIPGTWTRRWTEASLATQFGVAGGVVLLISALIIGAWVSGRIEGSVVRNTATATAQYMDSFIAPLAQDLAESDRLSPVAQRALDEIFTNTALGERVASFKIWSPEGMVVASSDKSLVGQVFPVGGNLTVALGGSIPADFEELGDAEDAGEAALGVPLLEIYSPIREVWSGRVIGVAEFYEVATELKADLAEARRNSWLAVALVLTAIGGILFVIVLGGSRTIDRQRRALTAQLAELRALSRHNTELRLRVQNAAARASAMNDAALRRIGADLHDGPAQLLGFAALRLDDLAPAVSGPRAEEDLKSVSRAVKDAMREVRTISRGLSLPDIESRAACDLLRGVVEAHEARTGTKVVLVCELPEALDLSPGVKICLYRMAQEGLSNAWRYAGGVGQEVALTCVSGVLTLAVRDRGPGLGQRGGGTDDFSGLGLPGLRDRVESLGGTFEARDRAGGGTELVMMVDVRGES